MAKRLQYRVGFITLNGPKIRLAKENTRILQKFSAYMQHTQRVRHRLLKCKPSARGGNIMYTVSLL